MTTGDQTGKVPDGSTLLSTYQKFKQTIRSHTEKEFVNLGLTGRVISAAARIPYTVAITKDKGLEIFPRGVDPSSAESELREVLSYLSSIYEQHTIVGWVGDVSLTHDTGPELGRCSSAESITLNPHICSNSDDENKITISRELRKELETSLVVDPGHKIVPVWLGQWADDQDDVLILQNRDHRQDYMGRILDPHPPSVISANSDATDCQWAHYHQLNRSTADTIIELYNPGDVIFIHDYHLMLLPEMIRCRLPSAYVVYFHYAEWPTRHITHVKQYDLLMGTILASSIIRLPSQNALQHFTNYCQTRPGLSISSDAMVKSERGFTQLLHTEIIPPFMESFKDAIDNVQDTHWIRDLSERHTSKTIIVAQISQLKHGHSLSLLQEFRCFIEQQVGGPQEYLLVLLTDRLDNKFGDALETEILDSQWAKEMTKINMQYGNSIHQPVIYINHALQAPLEYFAWLSIADLGFVAMEHSDFAWACENYALCQRLKRSPLLLLSPTSQAWGVQIQVSKDPENYNNVEGLATRIQDALNMDNDSKHQQHETLLNDLSSLGVINTLSGFLYEAYTCIDRYNPLRHCPYLDVENLTMRYASANKRLLMFDYDGTLTPIVENPDAALPTEELLDSLTKLATMNENKVWIISGRSRKFLEQHFGHVGSVGLSAEHGSFVRGPEERDWKNLAADMDMTWKGKAREVFLALEQQVKGSWTEYKEVAIVWHYRNADDHSDCQIKAVETKAYLENEKLKGWDVEVMLGKANVEVRPRFLNKGMTAASLIKQTFQGESTRFVLCAGDDVTDEDMFRALLLSKLDRQELFSCLVSTFVKPSLAYYRLSEPHELVNALARLSEMDSRSPILKRGG